MIRIFDWINQSGRIIDKSNEMWHLHSGIWTPVTATGFFLFVSYCAHLPEDTPFGAEGISLALLVAGSISATGAPIGTLINRDMMGDGVGIESEVQRLVGFWLTSLAFFIQLVSPLGNLNWVEENLPLPVSFHSEIALFLLILFIVLLFAERRMLNKWDEGTE